MTAEYNVQERKTDMKVSRDYFSSYSVHVKDLELSYYAFRKY